jgi:hypothetical protein
VARGSPPAKRVDQALTVLGRHYPDKRWLITQYRPDWPAARQLTAGPPLPANVEGGVVQPASGLDQAAVGGPAGQLVAAGELQLAQHRGDMGLDRLDRQVQAPADFLVGEPAGDVA